MCRSMAVRQSFSVSGLRWTFTKARMERAARSATVGSGSGSGGLGSRPRLMRSKTRMELEIGILRIETRDAEQGKRLRRWMDRHVLPEFRERTLPVDAAAALKCARLHVPDPRAGRDALIASTAIVHGMTVVTGNVADFEATGVALTNPWAET